MKKSASPLNVEKALAQMRNEAALTTLGEQITTGCSVRIGKNAKMLMAQLHEEDQALSSLGSKPVAFCHNVAVEQIVALKGSK